MTDLSRVDKHLYRHRKVRRARQLNRGAMALWLLANCWCRDHRRQGVISREAALELGDDDEIDTLVEVGLWEPVVDDSGVVVAYRFHDWRDWNPDLISSGPRSSAMWIVQHSLPDQPFETQRRLAAEVEKLIGEGVDTRLIEAGLSRWESRADARPTWLPYLVSDEIRARKSGIRAVIAEARRTNDVSVLREWGYRWTPPPPLEGPCTAAQLREHVRRDRQQWLDEIEANLPDGDS